MVSVDQTTRQALEALLAWSDRMPDAGLTDADPRRAWWFERPAAQARAALAAPAPAADQIARQALAERLREYADRSTGYIYGDEVRDLRDAADALAAPAPADTLPSPERIAEWVDGARKVLADDLPADSRLWKSWALDLADQVLALASVREPAGIANLVKAGALIAAEIDRQLRRSAGGERDA